MKDLRSEVSIAKDELIRSGRLSFDDKGGVFKYSKTSQFTSYNESINDYVIDVDALLILRGRVDAGSLLLMLTR